MKKRRSLKRTGVLKKKLSDEMRAWIRAMTVAVITEIKTHPEDWPVRISLLQDPKANRP